MKALLRVLQIALLLTLAGGAFALRCHKVRAFETFIQGHVYFLDGDCYARMSRVRLIAEHPGTIVRHHDFENFPQGIRSHATAPLDYLILFGKWAIDAAFADRSWGKSSVLATQSADLAGALISPLLGAATCVFLALWGWWVTAPGSDGVPPSRIDTMPGRPRSLGFASGTLRVVAAIAPPLLCAVSSILVHATSLGRPDHQSLLVFLLAIALGAEAMLAREATKPWAIAAGLAWGLALWVSLYEPPILLAAVALLLLVSDRRAFLAPARRWEGACLGGLLLLSFLVEGWRLGGLTPEVMRYFPAWSRTVGELGSVSLLHPELPQWMGWLFYVSPVLLIAGQWVDRRAWPWLALFLLTLGLTCWQLRWGYFLALVFAMTLPWQLAALRRWWLAVPVLLVSLFGPARFVETALFPDDAMLEAAAIRNHERLLLRQIAGEIYGPFVAPWWESPPLAYWSRQSAVAGSSHESLPGIVDVSRFYLDVHNVTAMEILRRRQVSFVVADEPDRLIGPATTLLGETAAKGCLANRLHNNPYTAAPYLKPVFTNLFFQLLLVDRVKLER